MKVADLTAIIKEFIIPKNPPTDSNSNTIEDDDYLFYSNFENASVGLIHVPTHGVTSLQWMKEDESIGDLHLQQYVGFFCSYNLFDTFLLFPYRIFLSLK
jgi:hypothetical protein